MKTPPKAALYFFRWFCHPDLKIPIEGDLMELYDERVEAIGKRKADWKFIKDVLLLFRRDIIKPTEGTYRLNIYGMIKNYFKVTLRSMLRQKLYSSINIGGLVLGLTSFITISLYIIHEYSYDRFLPNSDRIYRVINRQSNNNFLGKNNYAVTPAPLPSAMMETCPEVAYATAIDDYHALLSPNQSNQHFWEYGLFGDRNFFNVFPYEFTVGDRSTAFENKNSIVLTESLALKISNGVQIIGESINLDGNDFVVTGIMKDVPVYSSMQFNFVANLEADDGFQSYFHREKWSSNSYRTFFSIHNNSTITDIEEKLGLLLEKNWVDLNNYPQHYMVEPLSSIHLRSDVNFDIGTKGNRQ
ncbi:MAG: ABC transporter permease, partial [Bacteroidota bacterium]